MLFISTHAFGIPVRNITTGTIDTYLDDGDLGVVLEDACIVRVEPATSILAKTKWDKRPDWWNLLGTLGCVYGLGEFTYAETSFSFGYKSDEAVALHFLTDVYLEKPSYLFIGGVKIQADKDQLTAIPSTAFKYYFSDFLSVWAKYMFIYDSVYGIDNAGWIETEVIPSSVFRFKVGGTAASYHTETLVSEQKLELSALAGLQVRPWDIVSFRYQFTYTHRDEYQKISNMIVVDLNIR